MVASGKGIGSGMAPTEPAGRANEGFVDAPKRSTGATLPAGLAATGPAWARAPRGKDATGGGAGEKEGIGDEGKGIAGPEEAMDKGAVETLEGAAAEGKDG